MVLVVDDFGTWNDIGTIIPRHAQWVEFPRTTQSLAGLIRLIFDGDFEKTHSFAYIRCIYRLGINEIKGRWIRIYPKPQPEVISYPHPQELKNEIITPILHFEVIKKHYRRFYIGVHEDTNWTLNAHIYDESFIVDPLPPEEELLITGFI